MIVTWEQLCQVEPELASLELQANQLPAATEEDFHQSWHVLKLQLRRLVGWDRDIPGYVRVEQPESAELFPAGMLDLIREDLQRRRVAEQAEPRERYVLNTSEAYDRVYHHLLDILVRRHKPSRRATR